MALRFDSRAGVKMSDEAEIKRDLVGALQPAHSIVDRLGGPTKVAAFLGLHRTRVSKWKLPKVSGGTGGAIPGNHWPALMRLAKIAGVGLRYAELIAGDEPELDLDWVGPPAGGHITKGGPVVCECVGIEQDESCPVGFPSLLCDRCNGKGFHE